MEGGVHAGRGLFSVYRDHSGSCAVKDEKKQGSR